MDCRPFFFKQFGLYHHRSTMKIGTDAILFSRWVEVFRTDEILDIGTGCGLIPMMLAQKGIGHADAVEIDHDSCEEAASNFRGTPWVSQLSVYEDDIREFAKKSEKKYDLVVSNPPFYVDFYKPRDQRRGMARHTDTLSYEELLEAGKRLLKPDGRFALVLPALESKMFLEKAYDLGFHLQQELLIIPVEGKEPNRVNMQLISNEVEDIQTEYFTIRNENHEFTQQYKEFLKDYYLDL